MSHGWYMPGGKKVSTASVFFYRFPFKMNPQAGYIDCDKLEEKALDYRPKILICGGSSYPREWDYARIRQIADRCEAVLLYDMAHISGLVAAQECSSPFDYRDIVTSTTHKSLRGSRGGIIFYRRGAKSKKQGTCLSNGDSSGQYDFEEKINFAVFSSLQGGRHNNHIAALAVTLKQVATPEYKAYIQQVKKNSQALASALLRRKCRLVTGDTDNHLLLWGLTTLGLTGTPAMTSRGCLESDFETNAYFLYRAAQITSAVPRDHGKLQKEFLKGLHNNKDIIDLRNRVEAFAAQFAMPGPGYDD